MAAWALGGARGSTPVPHMTPSITPKPWVLPPAPQTLGPASCPPNPGSCLLPPKPWVLPPAPRTLDPAPLTGPYCPPASPL